MTTPVITEWSVRRRLIPWYPAEGERALPLGRNVYHDSRNLWYPYRRTAGTLVTVLHERNAPILDQGDVGCHDDQTDVLTAEGWQRWPDYDGHTPLGTVNPATRALEFQEPSAVQAYDYSGPMLRVAGSTLDFSVTPNHRMWVRRWDERARTLRPEFGFTRMDEIGWYSGLLAAPSGYRGVGLREIEVGPYTMPGDDFVALAALVASDGWVGGTDNNQHRVSFCCFRGDRREMVAALAQRLGFTEQPGRPGVWYAARPALAEWFRANLYAGTTLRSPYKRLPGVIRHLDQRQTALFLDFYGDQHVADDGRRQFYTSSPAISDGLQELLLRTGRRPGIYTRGPRTSVMQDGREVRGTHPDITVTEWAKDTLSVERKKQVETEDYQGGVYCATVPNGILVTRRDGKVLVSGNSCTGNGAVGCMACEPVFKSLPAGTALDEPLALKVYSGAEDIDGDGPYPPNDNGSSGPSAAKETMKLGLVAGYVHCLSLADVLDALQASAVSIGINWYTSFDNPPASGLLTISPGASVRGGHEPMLRGIDVDKQTVFGDNSWGVSWGPLGGSFEMGWATLERLLAEQGDGTVLVPLGATPPVPNPPDPTPGPVVGPEDQALWSDRVRNWAEHEHHTGDNHHTAMALRAWRDAKGFQ